MMRISCFLCVAALVVSSAQAAEPTLKKVIPTDSVQFARAFSTDGQVCTLLFDNLLIDTEIGRGTAPSVRSKQFSYVFTPESDGEVCIVQTIRGFVSTQGASSASLLIHSGGEATNVDFDKAIATAKKGTITRDAELVKKAKALADEQGFAAKPKKDKSDDFQITIERHVAKGATLQTTLNLLVERATGDDSPAAVIFIDSIDVSVLPVKKKK
jgi:hypothetical protein